MDLIEGKKIIERIRWFGIFSLEKKSKKIKCDNQKKTEEAAKK